MRDNLDSEARSTVGVYIPAEDVESDSSYAKDSVFPASSWAVNPKIFKSQLSSKTQCFIRLVLAPILFISSFLFQDYAFDQAGAWGVLLLLITLPFFCWSLAAMLFTNEYREELTITFRKELSCTVVFGKAIISVLATVGMGIVCMAFRLFGRK